jgi:hypothetical protein
MKTLRTLMLTVTQVLAFLLATPSYAGWLDITSQVEAILGGSKRYSPVYLQNGSPKNIKSVNFKNTIYRRGVFSYSIDGSTARSTFLFDCREANYKTSDSQAGYWSTMSWITPSISKNDFTWAAYTFLCPNAKDPWFPIAEDIRGMRYYVNVETGYKFQSPVYGEVSTWVMAKYQDPRPAGMSASLNERLYELQRGILLSSTFETSSSSASSLLRLYIACKGRLLGIYSLIGDPDRNSVALKDPNPGSVAEQMVSAGCP